MKTKEELIKRRRSMKQIKDVDILKDKLRKAVDELCEEESITFSCLVYEIIDSLAVEVPEAKSGAIGINQSLDLVCSECQNANDKNRYCPGCCITAARAELAQLQAELKEEKDSAGIDREESRIVSANQRSEIKNLKGALRTLAEVLENINWISNAKADKIIENALANQQRNNRE